MSVGDTTLLHFVFSSLSTGTALEKLPKFEINALDKNPLDIHLNSVLRTKKSATAGSFTSLSPHTRGFALTFLAVATAPCTPLCTTLHAAVVQQRYANGGRITNRVCSSMFAVLQVHGAGSCQRDSWGNYMAECNVSGKTYYRLWGFFCCSCFSEATLPVMQIRT